jgi:hypothetical protein
MATMLEQFCFVISVTGLDRPCNGDGYDDEDDNETYKLIMLVFL